jgi:hypothetical protein
VKLTEKAWLRWCDQVAKIKLDLGSLVNDEAYQTSFRAIVNDNLHWIQLHHGTYFCEFVFRCYVPRAAMAIRRQTKIDPDAVSLMRLMEQIRTCAAQLTYDFYLSRHPPDTERAKAGHPEWQRSTFSLLSADGKCVDPSLVETDMEGARALNAGIEALADRTIAHLDKHGFQETVTWKDLTAAVANFNALACKYIAFLTGSGYTTLKAEVQANWKLIFAYPFMSPPNG